MKGREKENMSIWFSSDHHFGHRAILTYSHRPFTDVAEMDAALIRNWNERVAERDDVYHLGDIIFRLSKERTEEILRQLRGRIHLVRGNHDRDIEKHRERFVWVKDLAEVKIPDPDAVDGLQRIVLCHYAMRTWNRSHFGSWSLYGHSHGTLYDDPNSLSFDVGVDARGFAPVSYEDVKAVMKTKRFVPIDHHVGRGATVED
jgi:calcineurin-like phosphoesterase family protein